MCGRLFIVESVLYRDLVASLDSPDILTGVADRPCLSEYLDFQSRIHSHALSIDPGHLSRESVQASFRSTAVGVPSCLILAALLSPWVFSVTGPHA